MKDNIKVITCEQAQELWECGVRPVLWKVGSTGQWHEHGEYENTPYSYRDHPTLLWGVRVE